MKWTISLLCSNNLILHVLPVGALLLEQKQYMKRYLQKPGEVKAHGFIACLVEVNQDLKIFLPFCSKDQKLLDDEFHDRSEYIVR